MSSPNANIQDNSKLVAAQNCGSFDVGEDARSRESTIGINPITQIPQNLRFECSKNSGTIERVPNVEENFEDFLSQCVVCGAKIRKRFDPWADLRDSRSATSNTLLSVFITRFVKKDELEEDITFSVNLLCFVLFL